MEPIEMLEQVLVAGVIATVALDMWQWCLKLTSGVPTTNWSLVGRWFGHIPRGKLFHRAITEAAPVPYEAVIGWAAHYAVGVIYAAVYLGVIWFVLGTGPTLTSAVGFGVLTVVVPWFLLQPGMGLGVLATRAPDPSLLRVHSLSSHLAFGVGLSLIVPVV